MVQVARTGCLVHSSTGGGCPESQGQMHMAARSLEMSQWGELQLELAISHKTPIHQKSTFIRAGTPGATCLLAIPDLN